MPVFMKRFFRFLNDTTGTLRERTVRSSVWITLSSMFAYVFDMVNYLILARLLVPEIFGLVSIVVLIQRGIDVLTRTSFKHALIYRQDSERNAADTAWVLNIIRGVILFVLIFLAAPWISKFYAQPILSRAIKFIAFVFILDGFQNVNLVLFEKSLDFKKIALARIVQSFLSCALVLTLAFTLRSLWALLIGILFHSVYNLCVSFLIQKKRPRFRFDKTLASELIRYSKYVTGAGILVFLTTRGDDAIIGKLLGMRELGFYTYAYLIANLPSTHFTKILSQVIFPSYSTISGDRTKLKNAYLSVLKLISYVAIPAGIGIFLLSQEIVLLLLGAVWEPVILPLQILVVFGVVRALAASTGPIFKAVGKPDIIFYVTLCKLVVILAIVFPLTKTYGTVGAALAVTLPMLLEQLFLWKILSKTIHAPVTQIVKCMLNPGLSGLIIAGITTSLMFFLPATEIVALIFYFLLIIFLGAMLAYIMDKKFFLRILSG
ncbi:MAG: oligosaccharide flippase family protein [Candidatus Aminicenantes bacterium]|nr:oligosaccharide flippase family protein [Candidatus Aminicenantes bacterium]